MRSITYLPRLRAKAMLTVGCGYRRTADVRRGAQAQLDPDHRRQQTAARSVRCQGSDDPFVCARLRAARCSQALVRVGLDASMRRGILVASECPSLQHSFVACGQSSRHGASQPWFFALLAQYPSMSMGGLTSGGWYSSSSFLNHLLTSQHKLQAGGNAEARPRGRCVRTPATP